MSAEPSRSKAETLVKVVLVFFISLLSFSVGTFVGKQVSDSDHRRLALEGDAKPEHATAASHGEDAGHDEDKISNKEIAQLTDEFVNKEKSEREPASASGHEASSHESASEEHASEEAAPAHESAAADHEPSHESAPAAHKSAKEADGYKTYSRQTAHQEAEHTPATEAGHAPKAEHAAPVAETHHKSEPVAKHHADSTHLIAEKVAHNVPPSDGKPEVRKPNSVLPSVASSAIGKYTVQIASYGSEDEAKSRAADLKGKGWAAFYLSSAIGGRTWYRVLVGLFDNDKSAREMRAQLQKEPGFKDAFVQKIVQ